MQNHKALWQSAAALGVYLSQSPDEEFEAVCQKCFTHNGFFEPQYVRKAIRAIGSMLKEEHLAEAMQRYNFSTSSPKKVGLVLASNIPAVGFHDVLATILMGHKAYIKPGSGDDVLIFFLLEKWASLYAEVEKRYQKVDLLKDAEAYIATGSDNAAMHFRYYFGKKPHIIRGNRTSVAILDGTETKEQLSALGEDVFSYFGMGCRNVTQLLLPKNYDLSLTASAWAQYAFVLQNHKYANNYQYQKTLAALNGHLLLDGAFYLLKPGDALFAPISVINYFEYSTNDEILSWLKTRADKIQCVVSKPIPNLKTIDFGQTQLPSLTDFADGVDTFAFLQKLHQTL
jgi:hypothetical protein